MIISTSEIQTMRNKKSHDTNDLIGNSLKQSTDSEKFMIIKALKNLLCKMKFMRLGNFKVIIKTSSSNCLVER